MHGKFDGLDGVSQWQEAASVEVIEEPRDDLDGMVGINVVIHRDSVCSHEACVGWELLALEVVKESLAVVEI